MIVLHARLVLLAVRALLTIGLLVSPAPLVLLASGIMGVLVSPAPLLFLGALLTMGLIALPAPLVIQMTLSVGRHSSRHSTSRLNAS